MTIRFALLLHFSLVALLTPRAAAAQDPCPASGPDRIACENRLLGVSPGEWDVEGAGDPTIQGFATQVSTNLGGQVAFKIDTDAVAYRLEIYRVGYYGGQGARRVATVPVSGPTKQPGCLYQVAIGLVDCGNWTVTATWQVPAGAVSGVYFARAVRGDTGGASHILFVVRDPNGQSDVLLQVADTTWQAYNDYGGNSLYAGQPVGRAFKVSYNRPVVTRGNQYRRTYFWATAYPMIRWLEANGYDVSYTTATDTDRDGESLFRHKAFLSVGHDEYWSSRERANVEAARDAGVHLAFFSGNTMFWRTRWEPSIDESATPYRTLVSYKETHGGKKLDPEPASTGTWRDPRFGRLDGSGRPENEVLGTLFMVNCCRFDSVVVSAEEGKRRFWRQTEVARQSDGGSMAVGQKIVGFEWDSDVDNGRRPAGLFRLSNTTVSDAQVLVDFGSEYRGGTGPITHSLTLYRHTSGAIVFSAGTVHWGWALDSVHDDPDKAAAPVDPRIQQATVNLFADMGAAPATLQAGLLASAPSDDVVAPVAVIETPASGEASTVYREVTVRGSATDTGGVPAGVEVSIDGGIHWHPATGASSWAYSFRPTTQGLVMVLARAVDDSGNLQELPAGANVEVIGLGLRRIAMWVGGAAGVLLLLVGGGLVVRRRWGQRAV